MKKVVAFLLALIIFVTPITTLVKADVVIGDNDDTIINENATILGRKLAMLESLSDLALSGVTEFTISNTEDVDTYLDSLWSEINDAINYLDNGEWVDDIPNNIASKYYTNLVNYRDLVNNRGEFLGFDLQNPATSLLKTYFANDTYGKKYTSTGLYQSLDTFRALSSIRGNNIPTPNPDPNFSFIQNINNLYVKNEYGSQYINIFDFNGRYRDVNNGTYYTLAHNMSECTFFNGYGFFTEYQSHLTTSQKIPGATLCLPIITINVTTNQDNSVNVVYTSTARNQNIFSGYSYKKCDFSYYDSNTIGVSSIYYDGYTDTFRTSFNGLSTCLNWLYSHFSNINLYVDNIPYALTSLPNQPTLDIDGFIKIYGNDNPQQYELQANTQIDYDQLYQVIYNAIRDNLPISQGDINYYDSHDTIYSPTIINNYGDEEGDESDLIDTILDYAVIPKFDTSIAQPMRAALTNGVVIMQNSINNVIPDEILLILGACFFLLLFAVVINRMIK